MKTKKALVYVLLVMAILLLASCGSSSSIEKDSSVEKGGRQMIIETGGQEFNAELYENETAKALAEKLPMTLTMEELNGNEKYYFMDEALPVSAEKVGSINSGDIMLYGSDCLVVFFKSFDTPYSYTKIGHIDDAESFGAALGKGTVTIGFKEEK